MKVLKKLFESKYLLLATLVLTLLPVGLMCLYIHPSADDYYYASWFKEPYPKTFWAYQVENYLSWNGRYFSTILLSLNPLVFYSFGFYKIIPIIIFALFYFGLFIFFKNIFKALALVELHIICLLLSIVYFNTVPSLPETLYWMPASVTYLLPWALSFLLFGLLIKTFYVGKERGYYFLILLLAFCIVGSNELSAFMLGFLSILMVGLPLFLRKKPPVFSIVLLFVVCASILFVVLAPGNTHRMMLFDNHHNFYFALMSSFKNTLKIGIYYFKEPLFIIFLLMVLVNAQKLYMLSDWLQNISKYNLLLIPIIITGSIVFFYFISAFSMGIEPPLRLHSFIGLLFLMGTAFFTVILNIKTNFICLNDSTLAKLNKIFVLLFFGFVIGSFHRKAGEDMYIRGNILQCLYDIRHDAPLYDREMGMRYELTKEAVLCGKTTMVLPSLSVQPPSIFFVDLKTDSTHWINEGYAKYFGFKYVLISEED